MLIKTRAPVRLELGGGATDMAPYDEEHNGLVLNATINKYAHASLSLRGDDKRVLISKDYDLELVLDCQNNYEYDGNLDLVKAVLNLMQPKYQGFNLTVHSDVPPSSGLGSSASMAIALIGLFNKNLDKKQMSELAFKLETDELKNVGGRQDQYAASHGGLNLMKFLGKDKVIVEDLKLPKYILSELQENLILVYLGARKSSGSILKEQQDSYSQEEKVKCLHELKSITNKMYSALKENRLNDFGELLNKEWETKKQLNPNITTPDIEKLRESGFENGAVGSRLMGAGQGGHLLFYVNPYKNLSFKRAIEKQGYNAENITFRPKGLEKWIF